MALLDVYFIDWNLKFAFYSYSYYSNYYIIALC